MELLKALESWDSEELMLLNIEASGDGRGRAGSGLTSKNVISIGIWCFSGFVFTFNGCIKLVNLRGTLDF